MEKLKNFYSRTFLHDNGTYAELTFKQSVKIKKGFQLMHTESSYGGIGETFYIIEDNGIPNISLKLCYISFTDFEAFFVKGRFWGRIENAKKFMIELDSIRESVDYKIAEAIKKTEFLLSMMDETKRLLNNENDEILSLNLKG